jgi:hypothetical protein
MSEPFDAAVEKARRRRTALRATLGALRLRATPVQIVEDVLVALDPGQAFIARMRGRMRRNKLLSLAVVAGAIWLTGMTRHLDGKTPAAPKSPRAKPKEKIDDSGQQQRNHRPGPGAGRKVTRAKDRAQERRSREARAVDAIPPVRGEPRRRRDAAGDQQPTQLKAERIVLV